ncbi:baseplate multidomain protein megatron [Parvularcula maris]|uniref:Glycoside hydrolase/phage tail family protein n=1 Tax=Parvularcula maris TaxID=2965077 RepID=A0A9X2RGU0_9PROT|nr:glycoside hydrolase TIM-barrel-like domain-containing protein [Parvularcula maris]MCQ8184245.1 glycoside hydrolase/phage tail family protein [Parvularcula maris]
MTQSVTDFARSAGSAALQELPDIAADYAAAQAGTLATNLLFGPKKRLREGRTLDEIRLMRASEGGGIPRVYGRARVGGQLIWTAPVEEETTTITTVTGSKGLSRSSESSERQSRYFLSFAVALCEGRVARLGRVWADGRLISLADIDYRLYHGTEEQQPDDLITLTEGTAPAYKGIAYIVFERLDLAPFGNRVPQLNFEVVCPLETDDPASMENAIRAVTIIPGSGEGALSQEPLFDETDEGFPKPLNMNNGLGVTDAEASFDELQDVLPNLEAASLVVSWFGDDLRAGHASVLPGIELAERVTEPNTWGVAGFTRKTARLLSQGQGRPSYGGTPSDKSVTDTILTLKDRGLEVAFHPFILMDVPNGNGLPDPYGSTEQAPFPWRGRITADSPSDDGTSAAAAQVHRFFDSYQVMIRHYAQLCAAAGGVDTFLIGSELRGLTTVRDQNGGFPAVHRLRQLAAEVKAILPQTVVTYGADWTEYGGYVPPGSDDLAYPLDPLWADVNIDAVGIDNYFPLTDWREGEGHLDEEVATGPYDPDYLAEGIERGEGYDWFYASTEDRLAQTRSVITDGAYGEPWVFRQKDLWSWWSNQHEPRSGGIKTAPTQWVPQSKPILFTEIGCAAIDKGPNQPNVFVDPKSSESAPPYHSTGIRDDRAQRSYLEAQHAFWSDPDKNPVSPLYGGPMVDAGRMYVYAWDARPFPEFPSRTDVWADAENWVTGHWLNGRAGRVRLSALLEELAREAGVHAVDASACDQLLSGFVRTGTGSARAAMEELLDLYQLDAVQRGGLLVIRPRNGRVDLALTEGELLLSEGQADPVAITHAQDSELPAGLSISFADELSGFETKTVAAKDDSLPEGRTARTSTSVIFDQSEASARASAILAEARAMRTSLRFGLPRLGEGIEPGTVLKLELPDSALTCRIMRIDIGDVRAFSGVSTDASVFSGVPSRFTADPPPLPTTPGGVLFVPLDVPLLTDDEKPALHLAAFSEPWPGSVSVYDASEALVASVDRQSLMGRLTAPLAPGVGGRIDRSAGLRVRLFGGGLESVTRDRLLSGANLAAVETASGFELLQFERAALSPEGDWVLSGLLRARRGTDLEAASGAEEGARFILLGDASPMALPEERWGTRFAYEAGPAGALPGGYPFRAGGVEVIATGARPLSPVHLRAQAEPNGTLLTWTRRSRIGGDRWNGGEIALGEEAEAYQVEIIATDGTVLETTDVGEPQYLVTTPGAAGARIAQLSASFGSGRAATVGF